MLTDDVVDPFLAILTNGKVRQDKVGSHSDLLPGFPRPRGATREPDRELKRPVHEDLAGDRDLGDVAPAAFGDPFELGARRPAAGGDLLGGLGQRPAQGGRALAGDVPEARFAVGASHGRREPRPRAQMPGGREATDVAESAMISIAV
jgi:hypothetical protein